MCWVKIVVSCILCVWILKRTSSRVMVIRILFVEVVKEPLPASYKDVALVIEDKVVIRHLDVVPNAFVNLTSPG